MKRYYLIALLIVLILIVLLVANSKTMIKDITSSLPKNPNKKWDVRQLSSVTDITIHHSETSDFHTIENMANYHISRGWAGIGYHFCIYSDGRVFQTGRLDNTQFHNGFNNRLSVGICFVGSFKGDKLPTEKALKGLDSVVSFVKERCKNVRYMTAHREYKNGTDCPANILSIIDQLRNQYSLRKYPLATWSYGKGSSKNALIDYNIIRTYEEEADN